MISLDAGPVEIEYIGYFFHTLNMKLLSVPEKEILSVLAFQRIVWAHNIKEALVSF